MRSIKSSSNLEEISQQEPRPSLDPAEPAGITARARTLSSLVAYYHRDCCFARIRTGGTCGTLQQLPTGRRRRPQQQTRDLRNAVVGLGAVVGK